MSGHRDLSDRKYYATLIFIFAALALILGFISDVLG